MDCPIGKEDADRQKIDCEPLIKINQWLKKNNTINCLFPLIYL